MLRHLDLESTLPAVERILGKEIDFKEEIFTSPGGRASVAAFSTYEGKRYLVKEHALLKRTTLEDRCLRGLKDHTSVPSPFYYGRDKAVMLFEYLDGSSLKELEEKEELEKSKPFFRKAIKGRAILHVEGAIPSNLSPFRKPRLLNLEKQVRELISPATLATYKRLSGKDGQFFKDILDQIEFDRAIESLVIKRNERVISHNDFHSGNILALQNGDIAIIDWEFISYGRPWSDLANLLSPLPLSYQLEMLEYFITCIKEMEGKEISLEEASHKYLGGLIHQGFRALKVEFKGAEIEDSFIYFERADKALKNLQSYLELSALLG